MKSCRAKRSSNLKFGVAAIKHAFLTGAELIAADYVRSLGYGAQAPDVEILTDFDRVICIDAEVANGALKFQGGRPAASLPISAAG